MDILLKWKKIFSIKIFQISLIFLVIANIIIWTFILNQRYKKQLPSLPHYFNQSNEKIYLPKFTLEGFEGKIFNSKELNSKLNILIFFSLSDCPGCLYEAEYWGVAYNSIDDDDLKIWGITQTSNREAIEEFCKEYDILFPILYDDRGIIKKKFLSYKRISKMNLLSPFKIFLDSSGKVILVEGPVKDREEQQLFLEKVLSLINYP